MLTQANTSRNFNRTFTQTDENGNQSSVMFLSAMYSPRNVNFTVDIQDQAYYAANKAECDAAIDVFKTEVNATLTEQGLPSI